MQSNQRGLAHNASKNDLSDNNYDYDNGPLRDSPSYNNSGKANDNYGRVPGRKPPIHNNKRNVPNTNKNMDLYNPSGHGEHMP